jgi:hypothetical protein
VFFVFRFLLGDLFARDGWRRRLRGEGVVDVVVEVIVGEFGCERVLEVVATRVHRIERLRVERLGVV